MGICIEIASTSIRCCRINEGRLQDLDSWSRSSDSTAAESLAAINLPAQLGKVSVVLDHPDMLLRSFVQPPCPADRLARTIRFELDALLGDQADETLVDWCILNAGGIDDTRVLALCAKRGLVDEIRQALAGHGALLDRLTHPSLALFHAYHQTYGHTEENAILLDCGGHSIHSAIIDQGHLLFLRSQSPGFDGLAGDIAEMRGIDQLQARQLMTGLGPDAPQDLLDLVQRSAITLGTSVTNNLRFAQAQLKLPSPPTIDCIYLAGAAGRLPGLVDTLGKRLRVPVRILNPFAALPTSLSTSKLDSWAQLPSPFSLVCAEARQDSCELDALAPVRAERANWVMTTGVLQLSAVASVALVVLALLLVFWADSAQQSAFAAIGIEPERGRPLGDGLIARAEEVHDQLATHREEMEEQRRHIGFLAGERRPSRIAGEFLAVIAEIMDPRTCPVQLSTYSVDRPGVGIVTVEISGTASPSGSRSTSDVLNLFEAELKRRYPFFDRIENVAVDNMQLGGSARQVFAYRFRFPDRLPVDES